MKKLLTMVLALGMFGATTSMASDTTAKKTAEVGVEKTAAETGAGEAEPSKWNKVGEEVKEAADEDAAAAVDAASDTAVEDAQPSESH